MTNWLCCTDAKSYGRMANDRPWLGTRGEGRVVRVSPLLSCLTSKFLPFLTFSILSMLIWHLNCAPSKWNVLVRFAVTEEQVHRWLIQSHLLKCHKTTHMYIHWNMVPWSVQAFTFLHPPKKTSPLTAQTPHTLPTAATACLQLSKKRSCFASFISVLLISRASDGSLTVLMIGDDKLPTLSRSPIRSVA